jgi:hypothetical protein
MDCRDWLIAKWQYAAICIEAVINASKLFEVTCYAMGFAEFSSACNNARKFG